MGPAVCSDGPRHLEEKGTFYSIFKLVKEKKKTLFIVDILRRF